MRVNREKLLEELESVSPGLSVREIIEQSSCFIFQDGKVITYNDEISCMQKSLLKIKGAVPAMPLLVLLRKMAENEVDITIDNKHFMVRGKRRKAGIRMESKILLPVEAIRHPKKWNPLPDDFSDAINFVHQCVSINESQFTLTCVHITPQWIEACDGSQLGRYKIEMPLKKNKSILVRGTAIKNIVSLDMTEFGLRKSWVHFRNSNGLIFSCKKFMDEYLSENLTEVLEVKGKNLVLPKGLVGAAEKADIFSSENIDDNRVTIHLTPDNKLRIKGVGATGFYSEVKKVKYKGKELKFTISPRLLGALVQKYDKCVVSQERLKVKSGKFEYVTVLGMVKK